MKFEIWYLPAKSRVGIRIYLVCFLPGGNSAHNTIIITKSRYSHQKITHSKELKNGPGRYIHSSSYTFIMRIAHIHRILIMTIHIIYEVCTHSSTFWPQALVKVRTYATLELRTCGHCSFPRHTGKTNLCETQRYKFREIRTLEGRLQRKKKLENFDHQIHQNLATAVCGVSFDAQW